MKADIMRYTLNSLL